VHEARCGVIQFDCFVAPLLAMTVRISRAIGLKKPKPLTADYADYADKSSYPNAPAPAGLEPTTTLGIRFICAIRDGFIPRFNNVDDCHRNEVREARRGGSSSIASSLRFSQ